MNKSKRAIKRISIVAFISIAATLLLYSIPTIAAPTYVSPSYGVDEVFFGAGGLNDANSASYNARASLGDLGVGNSASTAYQAYGGFTTTTDPFIALTVNPTTTDLGYLSTTATATATGTFEVRAYLAEGYSVVNASDPPIYQSTTSHTLANLATQTAPATGTEQFGINLVANTVPTTVGANPVQLPDNSFSYGQVNANYATANQYRYNKGDTVAYSTKSSGITQYTVTYMYNISEATPAGEYVFRHALVATAPY